MSRTSRGTKRRRCQVCSQLYVRTDNCPINHGMCKSCCDKGVCHSNKYTGMALVFFMERHRNRWGFRAQAFPHCPHLKTFWLDNTTKPLCATCRQPLAHIYPDQSGIYDYPEVIQQHRQYYCYPFLRAMLGLRNMLQTMGSIAYTVEHEKSRNSTAQTAKTLRSLVETPLSPYWKRRHSTNEVIELAYLLENAQSIVDTFVSRLPDNARRKWTLRFSQKAAEEDSSQNPYGQNTSYSSLFSESAGYINIHCKSLAEAPAPIPPLTIDAIVGDALHEIGHVILDRWQRSQEGVDHLKSFCENIVTDVSINHSWAAYSPAAGAYLARGYHESSTSSGDEGLNTMLKFMEQNYRMSGAALLNCIIAVGLYFKDDLLLKLIDAEKISPRNKGFVAALSEGLEILRVAAGVNIFIGSYQGHDSLTMCREKLYTLISTWDKRTQQQQKKEEKAANKGSGGVGIGSPNGKGTGEGEPENCSGSNENEDEDAADEDEEDGVGGEEDADDEGDDGEQEASAGKGTGGQKPTGDEDSGEDVAPGGGKVTENLVDEGHTVADVDMKNHKGSEGEGGAGGGTVYTPNEDEMLGCPAGNPDEVGLPSNTLAAVYDAIESELIEYAAERMFLQKARDGRLGGMYQPSSAVASSEEVVLAAAKLQEALDVLITHRPLAGRKYDGRLSTPDLWRLWDASSSEPRVFKRRAPPTEHDLALMVLADCSGSVGSDQWQLMMYAMQAVYQSTNGKSGIDTYLYSFEGESVFRHADPAMGGLGSIERQGAGGTPTAAALTISSDRMLKYSPGKSRYLIIVITDGEPNNGPDSVRTVVEKLRADSVDVLGLGIASGVGNVDRMQQRLEQGFGHTCRTIAGFSALPKALESLLQEVL